MFQASDGPRFVLKTGNERWVFRILLRQYLQRDIALGLRIVGLKDGCHTAHADLLDDAITADFTSDHAVTCLLWS